MSATWTLERTALKEWAVLCDAMARGDIIAMVRKGGIVSFFGGCPKGTNLTVDSARLHYDAIELKGTFHHTPQTVRKALDLLAGGLSVAPLVSDSAPLTELPAILKELAAGSGKIKFAIHPN